jgi:hypothetical protein
LITAGAYSSIEACLADISLVWENCIRYYSQDRLKNLDFAKDLLRRARTLRDQFEKFWALKDGKKKGPSSSPLTTGGAAGPSKKATAPPVPSSAFGGSGNHGNNSQLPASLQMPRSPARSGNVLNIVEPTSSGFHGNHRQHPPSTPISGSSLTALTPVALVPTSSTMSDSIDIMSIDTPLMTPAATPLSSAGGGDKEKKKKKKKDKSGEKDKSKKKKKKKSLSDTPISITAITPTAATSAAGQTSFPPSSSLAPLPQSAMTGYPSLSSPARYPLSTFASSSTFVAPSSSSSSLATTGGGNVSSTSQSLTAPVRAPPTNRIVLKLSDPSADRSHSPAPPSSAVASSLGVVSTNLIVPTSPPIPPPATVVRRAPIIRKPKVAVKLPTSHDRTAVMDLVSSIMDQFPSVTPPFYRPPSPPPPPPPGSDNIPLSAFDDGRSGKKKDGKNVIRLTLARPEKSLQAAAHSVAPTKAGPLRMNIPLVSATRLHRPIPVKKSSLARVFGVDDNDTNDTSTPHYLSPLVTSSSPIATNTTTPPVASAPSSVHSSDRDNIHGDGISKETSMSLDVTITKDAVARSSYTKYGFHDIAHEINSDGNGGTLMARIRRYHLSPIDMVPCAMEHILILLAGVPTGTADNTMKSIMARLRVQVHRHSIPARHWDALQQLEPSLTLVCYCHALDFFQSLGLTFVGFM